MDKDASQPVSQTDIKDAAKRMALLKWKRRMATEEKLYFLSLKVNIDMEGGIDLPGKIGIINTVLDGYANSTQCLYKFKVTGEPVVIAVFSVSNVIGLERTVSGLARVGQLDIQCSPVIPYRVFAKRIGAQPELTQPSPSTLKGETELTWMNFTVEHHGKNTEELIDIWRTEANKALGARASGAKLELFKCVGSRKVHCFAGASVHTDDGIDDLSFTLPLMQMNGENTNIATKGLQDLNFYCSKISDEKTC